MLKSRESLTYKYPMQAKEKFSGSIAIDILKKVFAEGQDDGKIEVDVE